MPATVSVGGGVPKLDARLPFPVLGQAAFPAAFDGAAPALGVVIAKPVRRADLPTAVVAPVVPIQPKTAAQNGHHAAVIGQRLSDDVVIADSKQGGVHSSGCCCCLMWRPLTFAEVRPPTLIQRFDAVRLLAPD